MRLIALLLVAASVPVHLYAQNATVLAPGSRVRVVTANGHVIGGTLRSLHSDTVVIADSVQRTVNGHFAGYEPRDRAVALGRGVQLQLYTGTRSHAGTGALIGGSLGFAVGGGFMYMMTLDGDAGYGDSRIDEVVTGGLVLGIPCALIGAALGSIRTAVWVPVFARGVTVAVLSPDPPRRPSGRLALAIQLPF